MTKYIAVLDREHLENKLFLTSFARSLSAQGSRKGIIIHGDSEYTERLIQTGMMRKDARERAVKDLNRRLIGLFADHGVSTIGVHGYQKQLLEENENGLTLNTGELNRLPETPVLLISSLIRSKNGTAYCETDRLGGFLSSRLEEYELVIFSNNEQDEIIKSGQKNEMKWSELEDEFIESTIPNEFKSYNSELNLMSANDFGNWPDAESRTRIS